MPFSDSTPAVPVQDAHPALQRLRRLSHLLDNAIAIPGLGYRVGIDPLIGLIPGGGDLMTGLISVYIVTEAARVGVPAATLSRMGLNILLELLIGTVPMVGDLFDVVWKANAQNVDLLEHHIRHPRPSRRTDKILALVMITGLLLVVIGVTSLSLMIVHRLLQL